MRGAWRRYTATTTTETGRDASYVNELIEAAREGRRIAPSITHNFWARADLVFKFIDAKGDGDGRVSRAELRAHFKGNTEEADYYMDQMDGFEPEEKDTDPDGFITLSEWHEFFNFCAEDDTNDATTSPAAAKALAALEYAQNTGATTSAQKPQKIEVRVESNVTFAVAFGCAVSVVRMGLFYWRAQSYVSCCACGRFQL